MRRGADLGRLRKEVGFVFQNPERAFFTETCMDEVLFGLKNFRTEKMEECASAALEYLGLNEGSFRTRSPFEVSCGEQRRLAVACALAYGPQLVFFDEPTAGLDQKGREFMRQLLIRMKASGKTFVLISHDYGLVLDVCDRVLALEKGNVVFSGTPGQLVRSDLGEGLGLTESSSREVLIRLREKGVCVDTEIFSPLLAAREICRALS
jgi:energy-coupling factor transport system ATP-binding protein